MVSFERVGIYHELARRAAAGNPVRVGVSGAGWIGSGFVAQAAHMPGLQVNVLADPDLAAARNAFVAAGIPADIVAESARRSNRDPYTVASYVNGTKTMFEMCCAANATGFPPLQRGMIGPEADLENVSRIWALEADGGLTAFPGAVDFVQGPAMSGGVFVTVRVTDARIRADLEYLKVGRSNYFTFFRPYHLWFLEAPISAALAALRRQVWNAKPGGHVSSCFSAVEILTAIYFGGVLRYRPDQPDWPERDRFLLSKGHAAPLFYAVLARAGYAPVDILPRFRQRGSGLHGHPIQGTFPGVENISGLLSP